MANRMGGGDVGDVIGYVDEGPGNDRMLDSAGTGVWKCFGTAFCHVKCFGFAFCLLKVLWTAFFLSLGHCFYTERTRGVNRNALTCHALCALAERVRYPSGANCLSRIE